jgi:hypothetical protein
MAAEKRDRRKKASSKEGDVASESSPRDLRSEEPGLLDPRDRGWPDEIRTPAPPPESEEDTPPDDDDADAERERPDDERRERRTPDEEDVDVPT